MITYSSKNRPVLKNCPLCGKLFADTGAGTCQKCYNAYRDYELEVKKYVEANPNCSARDIVKNTGAPLAVASKMIQSGQFAMNGKLAYPCSRCGKLIKAGVYCSECQQAIQQATDETNRALPYRLGLSVGSIDVARGDRRSLDACVQDADSLMYENKKRRKALR